MGMAAADRRAARLRLLEAGRAPGIPASRPSQAAPGAAAQPGPEVAPVSCGMPCWYCDQPVPAGRHRLDEMQRVFCSDDCDITFRTWQEYMAASEEIAGNDQPGVKEE